MMDAPAALRDRRARAAASLVVAALAIVVTAVGHGLAGGAVPHPVALLLGLVATALVGILVIGPRPTASRLALGVSVDQLLLHGLFTALGTAAAPAPAALAPASRAAHASHAAPALMPTHSSGGDALLALLDPVMAGHHALAGVVVLALLLRGRASLIAAFTALELRISRALTPLDALRAPVTPRPVAIPAAPAAPRSALAPRPERRRGPPAFALAA
ncbi:hypothetical protein OVN20_08170 [Microcella daejeonensis]|uniref:hypothetical protein n=1 Tax=Microcella daejeonensis TaxID=2994971 RepID=UPI0022718FB0|nr:hypothetical protein [Microcella daejeonensis]WAB83076.1 hypothetical protein OVN20_08170 [Microcella daejeonensis]